MSNLKVEQRDTYEKTQKVIPKRLHEILVKWINMIELMIRLDQLQCTLKKGDQNIYHLQKSYVKSLFYNQLAGL